MIRETIKISAALIVLSSTLPSTSYASDADNIIACIDAIKSHAGKTVDAFNVKYTDKFFNLNTAEWPEIKCEVLLGFVDGLTVDGKVYIVDGFAGFAAKKAYENMEEETEHAVTLLESRISLLEHRLKESKRRLKLPKPKIEEIQRYISEGLNKSTGN